MNGDPGLNLIGIDFNSAAPELRARFHLTQQQIGELYRRNVVPEETIIVSTCNRTEFYFWSDATVPLLNRLKAVYGENMTPQSFYCGNGADVVLHLLELAVGLKSMLIGENEILGQIESAWQMRNQISGPKLVLVGLFQRVVGAARRIRHRTNIGGYSASLYTLVIKELKGQGGALAERSALIMGNGEIGRTFRPHHGQW